MRNRIERKEKRKALRPWKGLTVWCIIFALTFSIFTPMFHILDNDFMLVIPGSLWKMKNADPSAIYYPASFSNEAEALAYGEMVARQVSEEGIVLLTNQSDALPLPQNSRISLFSTSSVNPVMGGTGSGRVDAGTSDTLKAAMEKEGFIVNPKLWDFYDAIASRDMRNASASSANATG
jgi:beta-glucosidase